MSHEILLTSSMFKEGKIPDLDKATCNDCGEDLFVDSTSVCTSCGSEDLDLYPSEEYLKKYSKEIYGD